MSIRKCSDRSIAEDLTAARRMLSTLIDAYGEDSPMVRDQRRYVVSLERQQNACGYRTRAIPRLALALPIAVLALATAAPPASAQSARGDLTLETNRSERPPETQTTSEGATGGGAVALGFTRAVTMRSGGSAPLRVRPSRPEASYETCIIFNDESEIAYVIDSSWENNLTIRTFRHMVFIKLLSEKASGDLRLLGGSGAVYRFRVEPEPTDAYDATVTVAREGRSLPEETRRSRTPLDLAATMFRGERPASGTVSDGKMDVVFSKEGLSARLARVYNTTQYRGFVLEIVNDTGKDVHLAWERFISEGLLLVGGEQRLLRQGESTWFYMVFARRRSASARPDEGGVEPTRTVPTAGEVRR